MKPQDKEFLTLLFKLSGVVTAILLLTLATGCASTHTPYAKVGAGYKLEETKLYRQVDGSSFNEPVSARFELGYETGNLSYGISHHSQFFSGWPFDGKAEYGKTEVFIDYKFILK